MKFSINSCKGESKHSLQLTNWTGFYSFGPPHVHQPHILRSLKQLESKAFPCFFPRLSALATMLPRNSLFILVLSIITPLCYVSSNAVLLPYLDLLKAAIPTVKGALHSVTGAVGANLTYDYVIVGGGTAGNTIGSRLAKAGFTVAIIEAGIFHELSNPVLSTVPSGYGAIIGTDTGNVNHPVDWGIVTTPQAGANNRRLHYTQGRCFGGS